MEKENIILITTDQQRFDTIQSLGNKHIFTPHLNYMVAEGISFTRCYADCPICVPSRTNIMIGKKGYNSTVVSNKSHESVMKEYLQNRKTLPAVLTDNGYQTKVVGKMHFEPARVNYGFEHMELPLDYLREHDKNQQVARPKAHGVGECEFEPVISTVNAKDSLTTWTVDRSINFIETRDPSRPFFLWTSFTKPHPPFDPCLEYWNLYNTENMPLPTYGDWSEDLEKAPQGFLAGTYSNSNVYHYGDEQLKASKRAYYALITHIDYSLGLLFGSLRENNLFENTWIIFTSDHGEMLGDHHMAQKNLFFEGSAHVPMIILPPEKYRKDKRNTKVNILSQIADVYPTILDIAGLKEKVSHCDGESLLSLDHERTFYGNSLNTHFCIMENDIKLIYTNCGGHYLLFDLKNDPMEQKDLSKDERYSDVFKQLKSKLIEKVSKTAPEVLENGDFVPTEEPKYPGDIYEHWYGFHYKDYSIDTFH